MFAPIVASLLNSFHFLSVWQSSLSSSWLSSIFNDNEQLFLSSCVVIMMLHIVNAKYKFFDGGLANVKKTPFHVFTKQICNSHWGFWANLKCVFFCPPLLAASINCVCASIYYPLCIHGTTIGTYIEDVDKESCAEHRTVCIMCVNILYV